MPRPKFWLADEAQIIQVVFLHVGDGVFCLFVFDLSLGDEELIRWSVLRRTNDCSAKIS